ncbi:MAG: hypothetical protein JOZ81_26300 [Chloroflexi bacterium]|nr:hypothetical protein [Chloroflexota bacterium]
MRADEHASRAPTAVDCAAPRQHDATQSAPSALLRPDRRKLSWLVAVALVLTVTLAYARFLGNPPFGSDTWPWLQSSRVSDLAGYLALVTSPIMPGTRFAAEVARFYHPVTALTYALDLQLFGSSAFALYATNLAIHVMAVVGLYALGRALGASVWAASIGALVLGLQPVAVATVPSLPRRQDLVVGALLIWSMWFLARANALAAPSWRRLGMSLILFFLALGGKEIAYAGFLVTPLVAAGGAERKEQNRKGTAVRLLAVLIGFAIVEAIAFTIRWRVLGGLGGYYGSERFFADFNGLLEYFVRPYVNLSLWPVHWLMPERLRDWLILTIAIAGVIGLGVASLPRRMRLLVVLGLVWQVAFLALYVVFHTSLDGYLLYVPSVGLALCLVGIVDGAVARLRLEPNRLRRVALAASGGLVALFCLAVLRTSSFIEPYPEWEDAGYVSSAFLDQFVPCVRGAASGARVSVDNLPHRIDYETDESHFVDAFMFEPYSLEAALAVLAPDIHVEIDATSVQDVNHRPQRVALTCDQTADGQHVTVDLPD